MNKDLCRGWTASDIGEAVERASPLARSILRCIARHQDITAREIAEKIGAERWETIAGSLSSWYKNVTKPMGLQQNGKDAWPFYFVPPAPGLKGTTDTGCPPRSPQQRLNRQRVIFKSADGHSSAR
jgi:hypothetical protein